MPVKWTPDKDQLLLLKILETHDLHVDTKKISSAWPDDGDKPTPRAITERLVKIRQNAKANGSAHFGISSSQSKTARGPRSAPSTPRKVQQNDGDSSPPPAPATMPVPHKRKRDSTMTAGPSHMRNTNRVKAELDSDDDDIIIMSHTPFNIPRPQPSTQPKTNPPAAPRQSFSNYGSASRASGNNPASTYRPAKVEDYEEHFHGNGMDLYDDDETPI